MKAFALCMQLGFDFRLRSFCCATFSSPFQSSSTVFPLLRKTKNASKYILKSNYCMQTSTVTISVLKYRYINFLSKMKTSKSTSSVIQTIEGGFHSISAVSHQPALSVFNKIAKAMTLNRTVIEQKVGPNKRKEIDGCWG